MKLALYQWAKANSVMFINAGSLIGTSVCTSLLGFAYWWLAARQYSPEAVGLGSAALSAMTLLGTFGILGLGTLLLGELPRQSGKEVSLISAALILVGGVGVVIGIVFAMVAPLLSADFQIAGASLQNIALFAIGVSLTSITLVFDQALIGLLRGQLQLWRNLLFAFIKLVALFTAGIWLSHTTGLTIYATWVLGNALSLMVLGGLALTKRKWSSGTYLPQWQLLRKLGPNAIKHHILNLTLQVPAMLLPVLVTILLSATTNAWFYIAWSIASVISIVPYSLTTVLYAASSAQPITLSSKARLTFGLALAASALANGIFLFGATQILGLFGHNYAEQAAWSLRILGMGAFPIVIKDHYVAICRIQGRVINAALPMITSCFLELGGATLGAHFGSLSGLSLGWLTALCLEATFMSPTVYKVIRYRDPSAHWQPIHTKEQAQ